MYFILNKNAHGNQNTGGVEPSMQVPSFCSLQLSDLCHFSEEDTRVNQRDLQETSGYQQ